MRRLPSSASQAEASTPSRTVTGRRALAAGLLLSALLATIGGSLSSAAAAPTQADPGTVEVIEVSGLLDPILVDFVQRSVEDAESTGAVALVLQLNSPGSVVDDDRLDQLAQAMREATVPVAVWIGPSGAKAIGGAAEIALVAEDVGMAPGTDIGDIGPPRLTADPSDRTVPDDLTDRRYDDELAVEADVVDRLAPTVGDFNVDLDGFETKTVETGDFTRREPVTSTRFAQLSLPSQLMHTAASPAVAYLFLIVGLGLVLFEYYTAGVGVAAVVALLCLLPAGYGLGVLPLRTWALVLLLGSFLAFAVDIQTGVPRFWTGVGFIMFFVGTLWLFDGPGVDLSWITLLVGFIGVPVAVLAGMPAMVRTRFSTPTIGREWMVGEEGRAVGDVDPEGTVMIREALWRARVNRATPVAAGDPVRVIGLDGPVLEIEPEVGAAKDYRDRS